VAPVVKQPLPFGLEDGTPVKLRINRTISSADAHVNETIDFEVLEEVKVHDAIVIPRGGMAWGTVTEVQPKRRMGRAGKLNINIDNVRLISAEKVALRAVKDLKGGGHQGAITGAMVATSIVFFPAAPLFLLVHGKDITIPKGTENTDGQPVVLRMMESMRKNVHYAIEYYSGQQRKWVITADPKTDAGLEVIAWVALPD
jgi:hypothetical protein